VKNAQAEFVVDLGRLHERNRADEGGRPMRIIRNLSIASIDAHGKLPLAVLKRLAPSRHPLAPRCIA
jgi:hypothetical protein